MKIKLFLLFLLPNLVFSQLNNNWAFPIKSGISFNNSDSISFISSSLAEFSSNSGSFSGINATVSDCNGDISFYTNLEFVYNKNHQKVINSFWNKNNYDGDSYLRTKMIVVPNPKNSSQYYIFFSTDTPDFHAGWVPTKKIKKVKNYYYSLFDVSANSGSGGMVFVGKTFNLGPIYSSNIAFAKHSNNRDFWILVPQNVDTLNAYLLDTSGLSSVKIQSKVKLMVPVDSSSYWRLGLNKYTTVNDGSWALFSGTIVLNHGYNKLFACGRDIGYETDRIWMYDFNRSTGKCTNEKSVLSNFLKLYNGRQAYITTNMILSSNDSFLYATNGIAQGQKDYSYIVQVNLNSFKYKVIGKYLDSRWDLGLGLGRDQKIYLFGDTFLYRIPFPNKIKCGFDIVKKFKIYEEILANREIRFPQTAYELSNRIFLPERPNIQENCVDTSLFYFSGDTLAHKLIWNFGDGDSITQQSPIPWTTAVKHKYKKSGRYIIKLSAYFKECNVFKTVIDTIDVKLKPSIISTQRTSKSSCYNEISEFDFTVSNVDTAIVYVNGIFNSKLKVDTSNKVKFSIVSTDTFTKKITVNFSNKLGCSIAYSQSFVPKIYPKVVGNWKIVSPKFTKASNAIITGCYPLKISLCDSSINKSRSCIWSHSKDSTVFSTLNYTLQVADTNNSKKYYFSSISKDGCYTIDSFKINGFSKPKIKTKISLLNICKNENKIEFLDSQRDKTDLQTIFWGDGSSESIVNFPISHHYNDTGAYLLKYIKSTINDCFDSFKTMLKIEPLPMNECTIKVVDSCAKSNMLAVSNYGKNKVFLQWGDGNQDSIVSTKMHHYQGIGPYQIKIKVVNKNGCLDTFILPSIKPMKNAFLRMKLLKDTFCANEKFELTQHVQVFNSKDVLSKVNTWIDQMFQGSKTVGDSLVLMKTFGYGKQTIKSIVYANSTCNDTSQITIFVIPEMKLSVQVKDICVGDSLKLKSNWTTQYPIDSLIYNLNGKRYFQNTPQSPNLKSLYSLPMGKYVLVTKINDRFQCSQVDSSEINVFAKPNVDFSYNENNFDENNQQLMFFDHTVNAINWNWDFEKLGNSNIQNPHLIVPINSKLKVHLTVSDLHGCVDSLEKELFIFHEIKFSLPTAITINNDGRNDVFQFYEKQWVDKLEINIFNRWGEKVFESQDKNFQWSPVISGTYIYQMKIRDINRKSHYLNGTVDVFR